MTKITYDRVTAADIDAVMHIESVNFSENEALTRASMEERINRIPDSFIVARNEEGQVVVMWQVQSQKTATSVINVLSTQIPILYKVVFKK